MRAVAQEGSDLYRVALTQGFYMGKYQVTQGQWEAVMRDRPWSGKPNVQEGSDYPAVYLYWNDVQDFVQQLNQADSSNHYRLPTEAEWEYACRAGTTTGWCFGDDENLLDEYAWHGGNTQEIGEPYAHPVGRKRPNPWGLFDMHGNVWEWVQDGRNWTENHPAGDQTNPKGTLDAPARVQRGGSFMWPGSFTRSGLRSASAPDNRGSDIGVRLVMAGLPELDR